VIYDIGFGHEINEAMEDEIWLHLQPELPLDISLRRRRQ
jgi:hypothetical protein